MKFINAGFGNMVASERVVAIVSPDSAPIKRLIQDARDSGRVIDVSCGRRTRAVLITDSDHVILSSVQSETISNRLDDSDDEEESDDDDGDGGVNKAADEKKKTAGKLFIVSGPAGAGKGEVTRSLVKENPEFCLSVSMTSRPRLKNETDGVDYYYVTREEFEQAIACGDVLEYTEYCGNYYGTPKGKAQQILKSGRHLLLEIEVNGAMQVKKQFPEAILVMILPPDVSVQENRLRQRGRDSEESILRRLARAKEELVYAKDYDYVLINYDNGIAKVRESIEKIARGECDIPDAHETVEHYFDKVTE